jgi:hypothetical protein
VASHSGAQICADDETDVAYALALSNSCNSNYFGQHYCCKNKPPLSNCHWVGQGDCAENTCNNREVTLARDSLGDNQWSCNCKCEYVARCHLGRTLTIRTSGDRMKSLCCTPSPDLSEFACDQSMCNYIQDFCPVDEYYDDADDDDPDDIYWPLAPDYDDDPDELLARALVPRDEAIGLVERQSPPKKKGPGTSGRRPFRVDFALNLVLYLYARRYPGPSSLFTGRNGRQANQYAFRSVIATQRSRYAVGFMFQVVF